MQRYAVNPTREQLERHRCEVERKRRDKIEAGDRVVRKADQNNAGHIARENLIGRTGFGDESDTRKERYAKIDGRNGPEQCCAARPAPQTQRDTAEERECCVHSFDPEG